MTQDRGQGAGTVITSKLAAMMFLEFFVWGAWSVTVGPYLDAHGMPEAKKWAYSIGPLAAIISPFFLGMVADRFFATERVLALMHFLGGVALLIVPTVAAGGKSAEWVVLGILSLHVLCFMPTLGLTNTLAFHHVTNQEKQFPFIRVFGTIGWIVANNILSWLHWDVKPEQFYLAGGAALLLGVYSLALPHTPPPAAGKKAEARDILGLDALALMRQRSFAVFVICSFLICIPLAAYYQLAGTYARSSGFTETASAMSWGQVSEIFFMLAMPLFFVRLGVKKMLLVGMLAWAVRYGLFAAAAPSGGLVIPAADAPVVGVLAALINNPRLWLVMFGILVHGICYDFFFVTGQIYVDKKATAAIRGQAQGFLVLVTQGFGMLIGAQAAGWFEQANHTRVAGADAVTWQPVWFTAAAAAAIILVLFAVLFQEDTRTATEQEVARGDLGAVSAEGI